MKLSRSEIALQRRGRRDRRLAQCLAAHRLIEQIREAFALQIAGIHLFAVWRPFYEADARLKAASAISNYSLGRARLELMLSNPRDPSMRRLDAIASALLNALSEYAAGESFPQELPANVHSAIVELRVLSRTITEREIKHLGLS